MYTSCWLCNTDAVDKKYTTVTICVEPCRLQQLVIVALKVKRDKTDHYGTDVTSMFLVRGSGNVESSSGTSSICCWCFSIACHYFHFVHLDKFSYFSEFYFIEHKGPHIVTKSIRVQVTLERNFAFDFTGEVMVNSFIKL